MKLLLCLLAYLAPQVLIAESIVVNSSPLNPVTKASGSLVKVFESSDLEKKQAASLRDLLEGESLGVSFSDSGLGGSSSAFIRGTNSGHILVILDGVVLNDPTDPSDRFDFSHTELAGIEKVEVYSGSVSSLYGPSAVGGVIYLTSKQSGKRKIEFYVASHKQSGMKLSGPLTSKSISSYVSVKSSTKKELSVKGGNHSSWEPDPSRKNSALLSLKPKVITKNLSYLYKRDYIDSETDISSGNDELEFVENLTSLHSLRFDKRKHKFQLSQKSNERKSFFMGSLSEYKSLRNTASYEYSHELFGGSISSRLENNRVLAQISSIASEKKLLHWGLGVHYVKEFQLHEFDLGLRYDDLGFESDKGTEKLSSNNISFGYKNYSSFGEFGLRSSTGFKAPSMYQLYSGSPYGNENLKPETSTHMEVYWFKSLALNRKIRLNVFQTKINDLIELPTSYTEAYINSGKAKIRGMQLSLWELDNFGDWEAHLSLIDAKDENTDETLLKRPKSLFSIKHTYQYKKLSQIIEWIRTGERKAFGGSIVAPYESLNIYLNKELALSYSVNLKIKNLLNRSYEEVPGFVSGGRIIHLGLSKSF